MKILQRRALGQKIREFFPVTDPERLILPAHVSQALHMPKLIDLPPTANRATSFLALLAEGIRHKSGGCFALRFHLAVYLVIPPQCGLREGNLT
jgi:hypothetical protein